MAIDSARLLSAAQAYRDALKAQGVEGGNEPRGGQRVQEFSEFLRASVGEAVNTQRKAETMSMKAIANEADLQEVINAVANAELTLETVVAVRDKVVQAYQEILRMPV